MEGKKREQKGKPGTQDVQSSSYLPDQRLMRVPLEQEPCGGNRDRIPLKHRRASPRDLAGV